MTTDRAATLADGTHVMARHHANGQYLVVPVQFYELDRFSCGAYYVDADALTFSATASVSATHCACDGNVDTDGFCIVCGLAKA